MFVIVEFRCTVEAALYNHFWAIPKMITITNEINGTLKCDPIH